MNRESVVGLLIFLLPLSLSGCQPPDSNKEDRSAESGAAGPPSDAQAAWAPDGANSVAESANSLKSVERPRESVEAFGSKLDTVTELRREPARPTKRAVPAVDHSVAESRGADDFEARGATLLVAESGDPRPPGIDGIGDRESEVGTKSGQDSPAESEIRGRSDRKEGSSSTSIPQPQEEPSPISGSFDAAEFSRSSSANSVSPAKVPDVVENEETAPLSSDTPTHGNEECKSDVPAVSMPSINSLLLEVLKSMPHGGGYSVSGTAASNLASSITVDSRTGILSVEAEKAQPSYCSGATYLALISLLSELQEKHRLGISPEAVDALLMKRQADGVGIWGRWNSNGPGTAKLFADLGIGTNFTDIAAAMPGDFMKIWWNDGIGSTERGHSVIFLGAGRNESGEEWVKFWSSNQDVGYSEKVISRSKIVRVLFSRLEDPSRINLVTALPTKDEYLSTLLKRASSESEMFGLCRVDGAPGSSLLKSVPAISNSENPGSPLPESDDPMPTRVFGEIFGTTKYAEYPMEAHVELLRRVQRSLVASGDYPDEPDGLPGPKTRRAISAWQKRLRLKVSGVMDEASLKTMGLDGLSESELLPLAGDKPAKVLPTIEPTDGGRKE